MLTKIINSKIDQICNLRNKNFKIKYVKKIARMCGQSPSNHKKLLEFGVTTILNIANEFKIQQYRVFFKNTTTLKTIKKYANKIPKTPHH